MRTILRYGFFLFLGMVIGAVRNEPWLPTVIASVAVGIALLWLLLMFVEELSVYEPDGPPPPPPGPER